MKMIQQTARLGLCALAIGLGSSACSRQKDLPQHSVVEIPSARQQLSALDQWIDATFLPYGIEVVYRWDKNNVPLGYYAVPPSTTQIRPVLEAIKTLCLELYDHSDAEGRPFLKTRAPLRIILLGDVATDSHGFELVAAPRATALELYVYNVNSFSPKSDDALYALVHSVHHQLIRRLLELYPYERDAFRRLSDYSEVSIDLAVEGQRKAQTARRRFGVSPYANSDGFLTIYGMLGSEADFADIIAANLCNHPEEIRAAAERAAIPILRDEDPEINKLYEARARRAAEALRSKQSFVEDYFFKTVGRRLSELQRRSLELISNYQEQHHAGA